MFNLNKYVKIKDIKEVDIEKENLNNIAKTINLLNNSLLYVDELVNAPGVYLLEEINEHYHLLVKKYKMDLLNLAQLIKPNVHLLLQLIATQNQCDRDKLFLEFLLKLVCDKEIIEAIETFEKSSERIKLYAENISPKLFNIVAYTLPSQILTEVMDNVPRIYDSIEELTNSLNILNNLINLILKLLS